MLLKETALCLLPLVRCVLLYTSELKALKIFLVVHKRIPVFYKVIIYDNTLTNFANNTVQNRSFGRYFAIHR